MKVKCINSSRATYLQEGNIYNVLETREQLGLLLVEVRKNEYIWFTVSRFEPIY